MPFFVKQAVLDKLNQQIEFLSKELAREREAHQDTKDELLLCKPSQLAEDLANARKHQAQALLDRDNALALVERVRAQADAEIQSARDIIDKMNERS